MDYETRSEADLRVLGAHRYSNHESTDVLCVGYKLGDSDTKLWVPGDRKMSTGSCGELVSLLLDPSVLVSAHNAFFEQCITKFVLSRYVRGAEARALEALTPHRFKCTAAKAAAVALPRNLEGAAKVLNLAKQKDMVGNRLVKKYMKPRPAWTKWKAGGRVGAEPAKWYKDEFELWQIYDYCVQDVEVEHLLDKALPDLTPFEREVWIINQEMNMRGVQIDVATVRKIIGLMREETKVLQAEARRLTNGEVTSVLQRDALLKWLDKNGMALKDLRAGTVTEALESEWLKGSPRRVLEIRKQISKTSNKKYAAMAARAGEDGRVRDLALYHGASTGRESGTGLQVHNLPRGTIDTSSDFAIDLINDTEGLDLIRFIYGSPFEVFSSCIRGMITATPGYEIIDADLNAIECRVLNWIAGNEEVLNAFTMGEDPYVIMASRIFGVSKDQINSAMRFLGKTAELGCGYQMGKDRFYQTCVEWGVPDVTPGLAAKAVAVYRTTHPQVVGAWNLIERAAIHAVTKGGAVSVCKTKWFCKDSFLWCQLPSGRRIAFYGPTVKMMATPWGDKAPKLYHWQVDPKTKQWVNRPTYGGKLTENVVQAIARDVTVSGIMQTSKAGYKYMFQVHDEIISEVKIGEGSVEHYAKLMSTQPAWAKGLPIKAAGWRGPRYKKD